MAYDLQAYVQQTKSVADAGRLLQNLLADDEATRDYAVTQLVAAAEQQTQQGAGYRAFMFSEMKQAPANKAVGARVTEEVLAGALAEVQVASVLIEAGRAVGETGEPPQPHRLDEALSQLEDTTQTFKQALVSAKPADARAAGHLAFVGAAAAPAVVKSAPERLVLVFTSVKPVKWLLLNSNCPEAERIWMVDTRLDPLTTTLSLLKRTSPLSGL